MRGHLTEGRAHLAALLARSGARPDTAAAAVCARALDAAGAPGLPPGRPRRLPRPPGGERRAFAPARGRRCPGLVARRPLPRGAAPGRPRGPHHVRGVCGLARFAGDPHALARALAFLGAAVGRTDPALARTLLAESLAYCRRSGDAGLPRWPSTPWPGSSSTPATPPRRALCTPKPWTCAGPQATVSAQRASCTTWGTPPSWPATRTGRCPLPGGPGAAPRRGRPARPGLGPVGACGGDGRPGPAAGSVARLLGTAWPHLPAGTTSFHPPEPEDRERTLAGLRAALGETVFATAWAAGQAQALEQACDGALAETPPPVPAPAAGDGPGGPLTPPRARGGGAGGRGALQPGDRRRAW